MKLLRTVSCSAGRLLPIAAALLLSSPVTAEQPVTIAVLGDSLTAGYGLAAPDSFPVKLEAALRARGHDVTVVNAGVSGDTIEDGLARLDWSVPERAEAVIVELGANNALRGLDPAAARESLDQILGRLKSRGAQVLLAGMEASRSLGHAYVEAFGTMYPDLAAKHGAVLYPFFLDGVALDPALNQQDGLHPNPKGVDVIVARILPSVEALLAKVKAAKG
jgi:acyl-CoA thioesterase-1